MTEDIRKRRPPLLFFSYLTAEMLAPFFASFLIMNGVFFLVKLIPFLNLVLEFNISLADFIRLFSYLFPNMFLYSIPMAAMLGITIGFSRLANDTEILAFKASGIGIYQALPPLIVIALAVSAITAFFSIRLIPAGDTAMQHMMYQLAKEKIDQGIQERTFTEALGDLVVHVDSTDKETGQWNKVWVSDMRDRQTPAITMARSGRMTTDLQTMVVTILLQDGTMQIPEEGKAQTISFDRYVINIPLKLPARSPQFKKRGMMQMGELMEKAREYGFETPRGRSYHTEFHKRLVLPIGCFFLALLGMPLGLQAGPGKRAIGIPIGLTLYILYYVMFTMTRNMAVSGTLPVPVVMWIPNTVFCLLAIVFIRRVANEQGLVPVAVQTVLDDALARLMTLFRSAVERLRRERLSLPAQLRPVDRERRKILRANARTRIFHFPECDYYYSRDCSLEFKDSGIALKAGFEPCLFCRTILTDKQREERAQENDDV